MQSNRTVTSLASGAIGALVLTALNEGARRGVPHAPRMEVIGMRALSAAVRALGGRPPRGRTLYRETLGADLLSNTIYYGLVGAGSRQTRLSRGILLGAAAGLGAVVLPPMLGLGRSPGSRRPATPLMTLAWYTAGGLAAGVVARLFDDSTTPDEFSE